MPCLGEEPDGCPEGQYKCPVCNGRLICKPCADRRAPGAPEPVDPRWSYCRGKGADALCVPMSAFTSRSEADAWFATQGRNERTNLIVITDPEAVTWGEP